ncbi:MAG TPA: hypothetical protein VLW44_18645 [Streptosporangiaceae bacterium]|nr:hypothetical protein [Streptosporangiaceae bacterium]
MGTHKQAIALRDAVLAGGESFAITRAIVAEVYPDGRLLTTRARTRPDSASTPGRGSGSTRLTMTGGSRPGRSGGRPGC